MQDYTLLLNIKLLLQAMHSLLYPSSNKPLRQRHSDPFSVRFPEQESMHEVEEFYSLHLFASS